MIEEVVTPSEIVDGDYNFEDSMEMEGSAIF